MIVLRPIGRAAADAVLAGGAPPGVRLAAGFPTELSAGVASAVGEGDARLGPFYAHRAEDGVVVAEIGGAAVAAGVVEIGYAVPSPCWGRGYATAAVLAFAAAMREHPDVRELVAHTPLDRPASARVLEKAGFADAGETGDEHEGERLRVRRWTLAVSAA